MSCLRAVIQSTRRLHISQPSKAFVWARRLSFLFDAGMGGVDRLEMSQARHTGLAARCIWQIVF